jgi:hypothetical protein
MTSDKTLYLFPWENVGHVGQFVFWRQRSTVVQNFQLHQKLINVIKISLLLHICFYHLICWLNDKWLYTLCVAGSVTLNLLRRNLTKWPMGRSAGHRKKRRCCWDPDSDKSSFPKLARKPNSQFLTFKYPIQIWTAKKLTKKCVPVTYGSAYSSDMEIGSLGAKNDCR